MLSIQRILILLSVLSIIIIVPSNFRNILEEFFRFLLIPIRFLNEISEYYWNNLKKWNLKLFSLVNINHNYLPHVLASFLFIALCTVSSITDYEILTLSISALGFGGNKEPDYLINPSVSIAISLISGLAAVGIVCFDSFRITKWLPLPFSRRKFKKVMAFLSLLLLISGLIVYLLLGIFRAESSQSINIQEIIKSSKLEDIENLQITQVNPLFLVVFFTFLAWINIFVSVVSVPCFPVVLITCFILIGCIITIPLMSIIYLICTLLDRIITCLFNILLAIQSMINTIFQQLTEYLKKKFKIVENDNGNNSDNNSPESQNGQIESTISSNHINETINHQQADDLKNEINNESDNNDYHNPDNNQDEQGGSSTTFDISGFNPLSE